MALLDDVPIFSFRRRFFLFLLALTLCFVGLRAAEAQTDTTREYQIKAAFLYNFVQFVKWPGTTFPSSDSPFHIGILGDDPFGSALDDTIAGESIDGHRLSVMRSPRIEELEGCQVIFVCRSEGNNLDAILSQLKSKPILTVSELEGFAGKGGDIDFYLSGGKVRFEINPQSARQCGLKMSSQLLSLGKIVQQ
jgi:hypothetical protein